MLVETCLEKPGIYGIYQFIDSIIYTNNYTTINLISAFRLMRLLTETYDGSEESPVNFLPGDFCVTRYSVDGKWYRATVTDRVKNTVKVHFVKSFW